MKNGTTRALANITRATAAVPSDETVAAHHGRRAERLGRWIGRGLFLLAGLSWIAALIGSASNPAAFAGVLTAGSASLLGIVVNGLVFGDDE